MYKRLNDLRFLRVAALLEKNLEEYEQYLRSLVPYSTIRERLDPLFVEGPGHRELAERLAALEDAAQNVEMVQPHEAMQAILDCEAFAHDYYLTALDRLSDPELVRLFRTLADEERQHMAYVTLAMSAMTKITPSATGHKGVA